MKIIVKLLANYKDLLPPGTVGGEIELDLPNGTTVAEAVSRFNVPLDETSVIVLNGLTVDLNTPISEGDTVSAFSAIAGG
jgi:molybdopterin converting factor small subunit